MADAFRGLTLRIGADARPVQSAISNIARSASEAQRELNRMSKALKFDGTNAAAMKTRIDLMGDKALHSARSVAKLNAAMRQTVAAAGSIDAQREFRKLVNSTREAHAETQQLRADYNRVDAELQHVYDAMARVAMKAGTLENTNGVLAQAVSRMKGLSNSGAVEYVKNLKDQMKGYGVASEKAKREFNELLASVKVTDAVSYIKQLKEQIRMGGDATKEAAVEFENFLKKASAETNINEKFGLKKGAEQYKELYGIVTQLIGKHKTLNAEYDKMNRVQGYRAMKSELLAYIMEVRQAASETARFQTELHSLGTEGRLASSISEIKLLDEATDKAVANAHQMIDAYKAFPKSFDAAVGKIRAVAAAEETLKAKTNAIENTLAKIKADPAFDKQAASSKRAYLEAVKVEKEYARISAAIELAQGRLDHYKLEQSDMDDRNVDKASQDYIELSNKIANAEDKVTKLKEKLHGLSGDHSTAALTTRFHELTTQLAAARTQAAALHSQVSKLKAFSSVGKSFREFGFGMYASLTPAMMMAGRYAIQSAEDIDAAYRNVRKTLNGTEEEYEGILDYALDYSRTHVTTAESMLNIMSMGAQLGIQDGERLQKFSKTISDLDIATDINADEAAEQLGKLATVIGLDESEYSRFGDALVRLGNNMPAMESDVMKITTRFAGMGKIVGLSADEMLGWATAATAVGMKPEAAGSSMLRFMSKMETAVNGEEEDLQKWADVAGMSAEEFKDAFEEDASNAMYKFVEGMGEFHKSGKSVNQLLGDLGVNNVRDKILLEGLANQMTNVYGKSNLLAEALRLSNQAYNGLESDIGNGKIEKAGDAAREAEKKSEGFSGSMKKMRNQAKYLANELADGAAPIVQDLGKMFGDLAGWVGNMPQGMKTFTVELMALGAALGPVSVGFGTFLQSFERIASFGSGVQGFFTGVAAKLNTMNVNTERGLKANLGLQKVFNTLGSTKGMLGMAAASVAIGLVTDAIREHIEYQQKLEKATSGVLGVTNRSIRAHYSDDKSLKDYDSTVKSTAMSVDELIESTASMVDVQNERAASTEKDLGQLAAAKQIIDTYANTDLSGNISAQGQLKSAVELLNDQYGMQLEIIDLVNGKIADETGSIDGIIGKIDEYIAKKQQQAQAELLSAQATEQGAQLSEAVHTWTEAKQAAEDYHKTWKDILDDPGNRDPNSGMAGFFDTYDKLLSDVTLAEQEVDTLTEAYNRTTTALGNVMADQNEYTKSVESSAKANRTLYTTLDAIELDDFAAGLQKSGMTMQEFNNVSQKAWGEAVAAWRTNGHSMEAVFDSLGLKIRSIGTQYKKEMKNAQGSTEAWKHALEVTGLGSNDLAAALQSAGMSAVQFANVGSNSFDALWNIAGQSLDGIAQAISLVNATGFEVKDLKINDEGLIKVKDTELQVEGDLARLGQREFRINADTGKFEEVKQKVEETQAAADEGADMEVDADATPVEEATETVEELKEEGDEGITVNVDANDQKVRDTLGELLSSGDMEINASLNFTTSGLEDASNQWETLKSSVGEGADGEARMTYDQVTSAIAEVDRLSTAINSVPSNTVSVTANVYGAGAVSSLLSNIRSLYDKTVTITTVHQTINRTKNEKTATGAIFNSRGKIPLNAAGAINGIVSSAMLTNIGWVGEAGAEAVMHMRNAGGAVIPLSNRRYVRPFAHAVASEIGGSRGSVNVNLSLNYQAGEDATQLAMDVASKLETILNMEA